MNVSELRYGNLIQLFRKPEDEEKTISMVTGVYYDHDELEFFVELKDGFKVNIRNGIEPIPLTVNILINNGFNRVKPRRGVLMAFVKDGIRIHVSNSGNFYYKNLPVPYLHLLQNLMFFATGEELGTKNLEI